MVHGMNVDQRVMAGRTIAFIKSRAKKIDYSFKKDGRYFEMTVNLTRLDGTKGNEVYYLGPRGGVKRVK